MDDLNKLAACPKGHKPKTYVELDGSEWGYACECDKAVGLYPSKAAAVSAWNESVRPTPTPANQGDLVETGWLIEFPWTAGGGVLQYAALVDEQWPIIKAIKSDESMQIEKYQTPIKMVSDSNKAIRFARKEDAETFIILFNNFLLHPVISEHKWM
jgi:hypothetical protein